MGNANGKDDAENGDDDPSMRSDVESLLPPYSDHVRRARSVDAMENTPPESPGRSHSPLMFGPQVPVAPLQSSADAPPVHQLWMNDHPAPVDGPLEKGIPTLITWNFGGNDVSVEGSWDNWTSRRALHRSGKDHSILLVLPSGVYRYKFIVDGEWRYIPDLPRIADEMGNMTNLLDVQEFVPENLESVSEFESPPSPESSYSHRFPSDEDFAKEPPAVPPQLHVTVLGGTMQASEGAPKPQHVVVNHLYIEKGCASQPMVALGLTHRFQSKGVSIKIVGSSFENFGYLGNWITNAKLENMEILNPTVS